MIEVLPHGEGFRWQWITDAGRVVLCPPETFPCDSSAMAAAKAYRAEFFTRTGAERTVSGV